LMQRCTIEILIKITLGFKQIHIRERA
jgi:hypothetical protein